MGGLICLSVFLLQLEWNNENMEFRFLTGDAYRYAVEHVDEVLQKGSRPYGYLRYSYNNLNFLIPLRSHLNSQMINKKFALLYEMNDDVSKGLDFTKLLIVNENVAVNSRHTYQLTSRAEFNFYNERENMIRDMLKNMIKKYIRICANLEKMIKLNEDISNTATLKNVLRPYRYSTLINYHHELGINLSKNQMIQMLNKIYSD